MRQLLSLTARVSRWLAVQGLGGDDLTAVRLEQFLRWRRAGGWRSRVSTGGIAPVLPYLRAVGAVPAPISAGVETPVEDLISRYRCYLVGERGLSSVALRGYLRQARAFLVHRRISGDVDLQVLDGSDVVAYLRSHVGRCSVGYAKLKVTQLRSLLRFLQVEGLTSCGLASAVPSVAGWRLTTLPTGLSRRDVARLLDGCDRRRGGRLSEVGQVLRHRSPAVTSIYARVDRAALAAVVQPWPGGVS